MAYYNILFSGKTTIEANTEEEAIEKLTHYLIEEENVEEIIKIKESEKKNDC